MTSETYPAAVVERVFSPDRLDEVDIHFDWAVPSHANDPLMFHLNITRGARKSAVRFQIDLARLATADLKQLHDFLIRQHAGLGDGYTVACSIVWLLSLSLQQQGVATEQIDTRVRELLFFSEL